MKLIQMPACRETDTIIAREVLGMSDEAVRRLLKCGRLPRYSRDYNAAALVNEHFWRLACRGERLAEVGRYKATLARFMRDEQRHGVIEVILVGSCPCSICTAALSAVQGMEADKAHGMLVEEAGPAHRDR
jgi:hypothetical protein